MARLEKTLPFSGDATSGDEAIQNPLSLISRPLYLDLEGQPDPALQRWEMPANDRNDGLAVDFERHRKADPIVVIGGFQFLVELGVIPRWLIHDATRTDAENLLRERRLGALLESLSLSGRENAYDLFGKASIHDWFNHSPDVNRESTAKKKTYKPKEDATFNCRKKEAPVTAQESH